MEFDIKITGKGSKRELWIALRNLADSIKESQLETEPTGKMEYEDPYLMAVVSESK